MAHMYMRNGKLQDGENVIRSMIAQNECPETVFRQYKIKIYRPDNITLVTVLSSCSDLAVRKSRSIN